MKHAMVACVLSINFKLVTVQAGNAFSLTFCSEVQTHHHHPNCG